VGGCDGRAIGAAAGGSRVARIAGRVVLPGRLVGLVALAALLSGLAGWAGAAGAQDAIDFPKLTGRVVDRAGLLDAKQRTQLSAYLEGHENATTNQVVVVTVDSLEGRPIEEYGYQLGRHWGIGQEGEDNGVLLIVAPKERKVRIEVGYGLEGVLTDAISSNIVHAVILPEFKRGAMAQGIMAGAVSIVEALGGEYRMREHRQPTAEHAPLALPVALMILGAFVFLTFNRGGPSGLRRRGVYFGPVIGGSRGGGFGGGMGGGFGGGGGGFGGGGASGGW
jgi:uncharacterized protein